MNLKAGCRPKHGVCARFAPSEARCQEFGLGKREGGGRHNARACIYTYIFMRISNVHHATLVTLLHPCPPQAHAAKCIHAHAATSIHAHAAERQHLDTYPQQLQPRAVPATKASRVRSSSAAITQQAPPRAVVMMKQVETGHAACWRFLCIMECTSRIALLAPPQCACVRRVVRPWLTHCSEMRVVT